MFVSAHDPFKPVDYRWQRAAWLRGQGRYARKEHDDSFILLAKKFQSKLSKCQHERERERLMRQMPGIYYAHELWQSGDTGDERWVVEARLLAAEDIHRIADRQDTTPEVIFWYEKLFFNVSGKLHKRDWLVNRVLGPAAHRGIMEREFDLLLKLYALVGGPLAVDALMELTNRPGGNVPRSVEELDLFWGTDCRDSLRRKAALAARTMPINMATQQAILEAHHRLLELEKEASGLDDVNRPLIDNIGAALRSLPFRMRALNPQEGAPGDPASGVPPGSAVELRSTEILAFHLGVTPDPAELARFQYPQAPTGADHAAPPLPGS